MTRERTEEEIKQLSLQQKIVMIREAIPVLERKNYSDEVSYDFTKIDDIYRYLAPAMNQYRVNLEVVSEVATKKDEHGNPVFVQYIAQCQMWMYEVDLTLKWINADNVEDTNTMVIHAIGSHDFPDKAKGSAWTYALKYYLLNKFCVDQGGEDPDMRGNKAPEANLADDGFYEDSTGMGMKVFAEKDIEKEPEKKMEPAAKNPESTGDISKKQEAKTNLPQKNEKEPTVKPEGSLKTDKEVSQEKSKAMQEAPTQKHLPPESEPKPIVPPASSQIKPESGTMVDLPESAKDTMEVESIMTIEEAMQIKCTAGAYSEHTLGSLAQMGEEGINALIWYAEGYRGRRSELKEGAQLLLNAAKAA